MFSIELAFTPGENLELCAQRRVEPTAYNMIITATRQNDIIDPAGNDNLSNLIVAGAFLTDALI